MLTRGKKIEAVGKFGSVEIPADAQIVDATGLLVVPGFIEMHNHTGATDLHDIVFQVNPELRVVDNIQFRTPSMKTAVAGGITTLLTIPGSGTNMGGFGVVMKTWGRTPADVIVRFPGALKIAQAGNPERFGGELGHGRMGMNWLIRNVLIEGREYHRAWEAFEKGETKTAAAQEPPLRDAARALPQGVPDRGPHAVVPGRAELDPDPEEANWTSIPSSTTASGRGT